MKENNFTESQKAMFEKSNEKSQTWKKSVLTGLGLVGATAAGAAGTKAWEHYQDGSDDVNVVQDERLSGLESGMETLGQTMADEIGKVNAKVDHLSHAKAAPKAAPQAEQEPEHVMRESLPEYWITEREVVTDIHGSQQELAYGFTEYGHNCVVVDNDMDGKAEIFMEDRNDTGYYADSEVVDLDENNINVSMDHLPETDLAIAEPEVNIDQMDVTIIVNEPAEGQEVVTTDDIIEEVQPDYTNDADLALNDDSIMANDVTSVDEFMA